MEVGWKVPDFKTHARSDCLHTGEQGTGESLSESQQLLRTLSLLISYQMKHNTYIRINGYLEIIIDDKTNTKCVVDENVTTSEGKKEINSQSIILPQNQGTGTPSGMHDNSMKRKKTDDDSSSPSKTAQ